MATKPADGRKQYNVALVGAAGVVGQEFINVLLERRFPMASLKLLATSRSAGKRMLVGEEELVVEETTSKSFEGAHLVFISASGAASREYCPMVAKMGAVAIDDSSAWRMDPSVPLVVPEINADDVEWHKGILAIPNCSTTPVVMVLWPLHRVNPVKRITAATYQSVSGTGRLAVEELNVQSKAILEGKSVVPHVYPHQIAFNCLPEIDVFRDDGYTKEEWKMMAETRKIMHDETLAISATCVRVPVFVSHSVAVHVEFSRPWSVDDAKEILGRAPGVTLQDDPGVSLYPQPWTAAGSDEVFVGRIRQDSSHPNGMVFWIVSDNLRKGAATNAVQIAEELVARNLV